MKGTTKTRQSKHTAGLTWGLLGAWALLGLGSSCRPEVLVEAAAGSAGEGAAKDESTGGKGGATGAVAAAGKGGVTGKGGSPGSGGSPSSSGGSGGSISAGRSGSAGKGGAGGSAGDGGSVDLGGEAGAGGTPSDDGADPGAGGAPEAGTGDTPPIVSQDELLRQTIVRWNLVADSRPPNEYNFHWQKDQFPHPTFQLGTVPGYHEFSFVLVGFLEANDNFDFLAENHQFEVPLLYVTASPNDDDAMGTFESLAVDFSQPGAYGDITADVQARLQAFADRMKALD